MPNILANKLITTLDELYMMHFGDGLTFFSVRESTTEPHGCNSFHRVGPDKDVAAEE
jgi:hypothetical protein